MQNFTPTTSFAIILVQATSMSPLGFCQASWLQLCPFFSPVIYELLSHPSLSPSETCQAHHNFHKSSPSSPSPTALCGRPSCPGGTILPWALCSGHQGPAAPSVCLSPRAPSESTHCRMTPACRPLPGSFGNYLTASHRNARLGFTLFEA